MLESVEELPSEFFEKQAYIDKFWKDAEGIDALRKFERQQTFREPGNPSWEAFEQGDVNKALQLAEEQRAAINAELAADDFPSYRLRVVEQPLTPYLWWELHVLLIRAEAGETIYTID